MPITISGNGDITGLPTGWLPDGIVTPSDLSTGGPYWDSSGRLLVGTTTNAGSLVNQIALHGAGTGTSQPGIFIASFPGTGDADTGYLEFYRSASSILNTNTLVGANDRLGMIRWSGANGTGYDVSAAIYAEVDGLPSAANDMPGRIVFSSTSDNSSTPTERMRISSDGRVYINRTTAIDGNQAGMLQISADSTTKVASFYQNAAGAGLSSTLTVGRATDGAVLEFYRVTTQVGSISITTTNTAYNTSSDYRLKENVTAVTDGITRLQQLKPSRFNFIADPDRTVDGFIAHEVQTVVPEAITGEKDAEDEDGNPIYQGIDQSKLVPLLTAALQEAVAKIESLEARIAALEVTP